MSWRAVALTMCLLVSCAGKVSDASLAHLLEQHFRQFQEIADLALQDFTAGKIPQNIVPTSQRFADVQHQGLDEARWNVYQTFLHSLRLQAVGVSGKTVWFRVKRIGEFERGITFSTEPVRPAFQSLERFEPSDQTRTSRHGDYLGYKIVRPNWYLYALYD